MKTNVTPKNRQDAITLLVVLVTCTIFAFAIMGYLSVIEHQNYLCARAQSWDKAMTIVEAGIEEGLEHLNSCTNNLGSDNWTGSGTTYTSPTRTFPGGDSYTVTIDNSDPFNPTIFSHGSVSPPPSLFSLNQQSLFLAAGGQALQAPAPEAPAPTIKRAVRVRTTRPPPFIAALAARKGIDLNGNKIFTDSFDSTDSSKSTNGGHYNFNVYSGDNGDIASNGGVTDSVDIGNAQIYGRVHTGPGEPVEIGPNGAVGTHTWVAANTKGIQSGYVTPDSNFTFPNTDLPSTTGAFDPIGGTNGGVSYANILETGKTYKKLNPGKTYVAGPDVTLILTNGMTGDEDLTFKTGAKLEIYSGGTNCTINGNQIINPNGNASSLKVFCAPTVTSFTLNGNGEFVGVLVAPNVDIDMNGGGHENTDFIGSLMVRSVKLNGHFRFHYDEALRNEPNKGRFLVTQWDEINPL